MVKLMIADDHQMIIDGIKSILEGEEEVALIGEALHGKQLMKLIAANEPDIVLMDINMPQMDGVEATRYIKKEYPNIKVIALSMYNERGFILQMIESGADGYLLKNTGKELLMEAIHAVSAGEHFFGAEVTKEVMNGLRSPQLTQEVVLTKREKEVIELIVNEFTTDQIAERLFISHHTVESHRKNILSKMGVKNTAGLVKYAIQQGIVMLK
jgi:two-component system nitrate/nitrite response regulator NarL